MKRFAQLLGILLLAIALFGSASAISGNRAHADAKQGPCTEEQVAVWHAFSPIAECFNPSPVPYFVKSVVRIHVGLRVFAIATVEGESMPLPPGFDKILPPPGADGIIRVFPAGE